MQVQVPLGIKDSLPIGASADAALQLWSVATLASRCQEAFKLCFGEQLSRRTGPTKSEAVAQSRGRISNANL